MQIVFYLLSLFAIYLVLKPNHWSDKMISGILSFFWVWMGVVYHLIFFSRINEAALLFGALFILQGLLFLMFGVFKNKITFEYSRDSYGIIGMMIILYALIIYPIIGYFMGHIYPSSPTMGLPCPTTIFTFGLLLFLVKKCPPSILIIPFLWSIIGFTAAFKFGVVEDTGLIISGLISTALILYRNARLQRKVNSM